MDTLDSGIIVTDEHHKQRIYLRLTLASMQRIITWAEAHACTWEFTVSWEINA